MTTDTHQDSTFAYFAGTAQAQVVLATGCELEVAATAVREAGEAFIGWRPDAEACRDVILAAVQAVRDA